MDTVEQAPKQPIVVPGEPAMAYLARACEQWDKPELRETVNNAFTKPIAIQLSHTKEVRIGRLVITSWNAHQYEFGAPPMSVFEHFRDKHGIVLQQPSLPLIQIKKRDAFYPVELIKMTTLEEGLELIEEKKEFESKKSRFPQNPSSKPSHKDVIRQLKYEKRCILEKNYNRARDEREKAEKILQNALEEEKHALEELEQLIEKQ